jgi:hypothetical protein
MIGLARFSIIASLAILGCSSILAQQRLPNCASLPYERHNQIDYGPLRVTSVRGTVKVVDGYPVFQACVGIFAESGEQLLAATANERGEFLVAGLPNGTYRMVITGQDFCAANVVVILKNKPRGKKTLIAVMKPSAVDVCSYIELE